MWSEIQLQETVCSTGRYCAKDLEYLTIPTCWRSLSGFCHIREKNKMTCESPWNQQLIANLYILVAIKTDQLKSCHIIRRGVIYSAFREISHVLCHVWSKHCAFGKAIIQACMATTSGVMQSGAAELCSVPGSLFSSTSVFTQLSLPSSVALCNERLPWPLPSFLTVFQQLISADSLKPWLVHGYFWNFLNTNSLLFEEVRNSKTLLIVLFSLCVKHESMATTSGSIQVLNSSIRNLFLGCEWHCRHFGFSNSLLWSERIFFWCLKWLTTLL